VTGSPHSFTAIRVGNEGTADPAPPATATAPRPWVQEDSPTLSLSPGRLCLALPGSSHRHKPRAVCMGGQAPVESAVVVGGGLGGLLRPCPCAGSGWRHRCTGNERASAGRGHSHSHLPQRAPRSCQDPTRHCTQGTPPPHLTARKPPESSTSLHPSLNLCAAPRCTCTAVQKLELLQGPHQGRALAAQQGRRPQCLVPCSAVGAADGGRRTQ